MITLGGEEWGALGNREELLSREGQQGPERSSGQVHLRRLQEKPHGLAGLLGPQGARLTKSTAAASPLLCLHEGHLTSQLGTSEMQW